MGVRFRGDLPYPPDLKSVTETLTQQQTPSCRTDDYACVQSASQRQTRYLVSIAGDDDGELVAAGDAHLDEEVDGSIVTAR